MRIRRFLLALLIVVAIGSIFLFFYPRWFWKKPATGIFFSEQYSEKSLTENYTLLLWNGFLPALPNLFEEIAKLSPDVTIFSTLPLMESKEQKVTLPDGLQENSQKNGILLLKNYSNPWFQSPFYPYDILISKVKPEVQPKENPEVDQNLFSQNDLPPPYTLIILPKTQGKLSLFIVDFPKEPRFLSANSVLSELKDEILLQYAKGNSVIVAGDWNLCFPGSQNVKQDKEKIPALWTPEGWNWVYTLQAVETPRDAFTGLLLSPGIEIIEISSLLTSDSTAVGIPIFVKLKE